ncbi:MAG TPA: hypothetical protein VEW45_07895 [Candidatus Dormibacteraeota bacterium]|nr:hypothetical protein [Candidatus Dormibacteraeota bacterium]
MPNDLATALDIVVAIAVVVGVVFGLSELRNAERSRRDHAAVDIVRTVQTQEVRRAVARVLALPDGADPRLIRDDPATLEAALAVDSACEMWGSMVFEGVVDLHMLDRMVGGWVRGTWARLKLWVEAERVDKRSPNIGEWWEWLYDQLQADADPGKAQAAHVAYRGRRRR